MPKQTLQNLISSLNDNFGDDLSSPQQQQLMQALQNHIHALDEDDTADPGIQETLGLLVEEIEAQHPQAATVVREVMQALKNMGI